MVDNTKPRRLVMVTGENNNKYYNMIPQGGTFLVEWGRVGVTKTETTYPMSKWNATYNEKVKKGYKDVTDLVKVATTKSEYTPIANAKVQKLFTALMGFSRQSVKENYTIEATSVTQAQLTEAQRMVDELTKRAKSGTLLTSINPILLGLYTVIPRRMKNVRDHLLTTNLDTGSAVQAFRQIVDSEQKTLDVMAG